MHESDLIGAIFQAINVDLVDEAKGGRNMDPNKIVKLISEDIRVNNGNILEYDLASRGLPADVDRKADELVKNLLVIDKEIPGAALKILKQLAEPFMSKKYKEEMSNKEEDEDLGLPEPDDLDLEREEPFEDLGLPGRDDIELEREKPFEV
jgi:hypothetical protein